MRLGLPFFSSMRYMHPKLVLQTQFNSDLQNLVQMTNKVPSRTLQNTQSLSQHSHVTVLLGYCILPEDFHVLCCGWLGFLHFSCLADQIFGIKRNTLQRNGITK